MALALATGLVWLSLASAGGAPDSLRARLPGIAAASLRPSVCRNPAGAEQSALWSRVSGGAVRAFCEHLVRAQIRLERSPAAALELALRAHQALPEEAAPLVLAGRALLRQGQVPSAYERFAASRSKSSSGLADAAALREFAAAATLLGRTAEAAALYRKLVLRSDLPDDPAFRRLIVLEAASLLGASGPDSLPEAEVWLSEARRGPGAPGFEDLTSALLALALARKGDVEQASLVAAEIPGPWALERFLSKGDAMRVERFVLPAGEAAPAPLPAPVFIAGAPQLAAGELHLAIAVSLSERDPSLSRLHLSAYLDGPGKNAPWRGFAEQRLAALLRARR